MITRRSAIYVLGIDIGTGGSRAIVMDQSGAIVSSSTHPHAPFRSPGPAWAEQDPADWWQAARQAIADVLASGPARADTIACVGLSGQMHGAVLLDAKGAILRPSIIWCDQRTATECRWLENTIGQERLLELTSNPALTNFTLTKLLWVRTHEPEIWSHVRHVLLPKDYVRFCLSGAYAIDVADASGTLMLDVARRRWSQEMLAASDIDSAMLPEVFESPDICATVSAEAAALTGLRPGTPIVAGAGDQAAGAVGMGITRPGAVSVTIGTSGVVFAATDQPALDRDGRIHTFCHAIPGRWHVMGVTQAAGLSLRWLRDLVGGRGDDGYEELADEAGRVPAGSDGVLWAPYLMGERTPHCDPNVRAALLGLSASHSRGHVARAVMEGVAFSLRDTFEIFKDLGVPVTRVRVGGGGARSAVWRQIQAAAYGQGVESVVAEEGAAYGAALLAGVGAGWWTSVDEACEATVRTAATTAADPVSVRALEPRYAEYRRIYSALGSIFRS